MVWDDVKPGFRHLVQQIGYPDALMTHCRGNSIGSIYWRRLQKAMPLTVANILYAAQLYYFFLLYLACTKYRVKPLTLFSFTFIGQFCHGMGKICLIVAYVP